MNIINIGIDIDGVINDLSLFHISCGTKFCYEQKINYQLNPHVMDSQDIFSWGKEIDKRFWENYYTKLLMCKDFVRPYAADTIKHLSQTNNKIFIITARQDSDLPYVEKRSMRELTEIFLSTNNIYYDELILTNDKWEIIQTYNINVMLEDSPAFFKHEKRISSVSLICFNAPYNQGIQDDTLLRIYSWYDFLNLKL